MCYGIAVGSDRFVQDKLEDKVEEITKVVNKVVEVLGPEKDFQAIWAILQCFLAQKLDWQLSLNYPSDIAVPAARLDDVFWQLLELCAVVHIPRVEECLGVECIFRALGLPPRLQGRSYQNWLMRQPVRLCGLVLRSLVETSPAAFCGGVEMALPHLTGEQGVCPSLQGVLGDVEGPASWREFQQGGSRTAKEFGWAWGTLM